MSCAKRPYHKRSEAVQGFMVKDHPLYPTWAQMMSRCYNKKATSYPNYGARGIKVCENWHSFKNFAEDMGLKPDPKHTLERINNEDDYSILNCRWASRTDQCVNRRKFKNNSSGETGVVSLGNGTFSARFDYAGTRYQIGRFKTKKEAVAARRAFVSMFFIDQNRAVQAITKNKLSLISTTGIRGITRHGDGGYIVRVTKNGIRFYVGYFKTINEADNARREFLAS